MRYKGGYFPVPPADHFADLRAKISISSRRSGLVVERAHHEVGTAGQAEINYRFDELLASADNVMKFKYIVKNVAWRNGKTATFMPKPIFGDNGSGMHCHQSLWAGRRAAVLRRERATPGCPTPPATTSAGCSRTHRRCWRSRTRP